MPVRDRRIRGTLDSATGNTFTGGGTNYLVQTPAGSIYCIYINSANDVTYCKSSDGGMSWGTPVSILVGTATCVSVWYDKWSGLAGDLIHIAYQESATDDTLYRTLDTSTDTLSTQTVVLAGASTATGGTLSICRSRGGNVYCATMIDAGAEGGFMRLLNANVPNGAWDAALTTVFEAATQDQVILMPGFAADNQDMICLFWDASADEISRKVYDDSANSWAETSIAGTMVDQPASTNYPHWTAFVDLTNSQIVMGAWSAVDLANADLRVWTVTESAIAEVTNTVLNSTDDQGYSGLTLNTDTGAWWHFYGGASDGSETFRTSIHLYAKVSKDGGTTWGPESQISNDLNNRIGLITCPRWTGEPVLAFIDAGTPNQMAVIATSVSPRAVHQLLG